MGQSPDELDMGHMTPAIWAAYKVYNTDPLKMLATLGADLSITDRVYGNTALHFAVVQGNRTAIQILIDLKVDLLAINKVIISIILYNFKGQRNGIGYCVS